ncbi:ADP-ribosyl-(dinitrogen reductase) hydrolase [Alteromonas lipotrueae]|uniref:ADP-ribosyl-(dinitrogen reductase) hydrolase n=1 Tax=Alteromonas lipotrueae TaxID=2803814 RepID=UPI001C44A99E|nr:ADP-ribosyl-(dinitrogen reductase) hydrolase [Alteromonas lipotrueae]
MELKFSEKVIAKLKEKHNVNTTEVFECFFNNEGERFLKDTREDHQTDPPTLWFVSTTDAGRILKVCFINTGRELSIKTAYEANDVEINIYRKFGN